MFIIDGQLNLASRLLSAQAQILYSMTFKRKRNEKERNRRRTDHCSRVCCVELESINWTRQMWPRSSIYRWFGSFRFHSFCNLFLRVVEWSCEMLRRLKRSVFGENENFRRFAGVGPGHMATSISPAIFVSHMHSLAGHSHASRLGKRKKIKCGAFVFKLDFPSTYPTAAEKKKSKSRYPIWLTRTMRCMCRVCHVCHALI